MDTKCICFVQCIWLIGDSDLDSNQKNYYKLDNEMNIYEFIHGQLWSVVG